MTAVEIVEQLRPLGNDGYKKIMMRHGMQEPYFGVKIEELKKFQKKIKKDYQLALDLFNTGIGDAMYLAGLIADEQKMTIKDLQHWVKHSKNPMICEYTVPWVAAEGKHGWELALQWIDSKKEDIATSGWATLSGLAAVKPDEELNLKEFKKLMQRVERTMHKQPDRIRYVMNGFIIAVGSYIKELSDFAKDTARKIGVVHVDMGDTSCKVPFAPEYIEKAIKRGTLNKKRKTIRC